MRIDEHRYKRVLIYSHDSFGLGHLRRCRAIAHALVDGNSHVSVLILSGSPIIGSFDFRARVDFVRIPGVIKLRNGEYTSLSLHLHIEETLRLRASIIKHTAEVFRPDLLIVDKEPLGLRGEVEETLELMRLRGVPAVFGMRDVMDDPAQLAAEWTRKNAVQALTRYYDEIWIYGLPEIYDPLKGIMLPVSLRERMRYTGYLRRRPPSHSPIDRSTGFDDRPFILVTPGGGGDGVELVDWVISAYEHDPTLPYGALLVFGPFMPPDQQAEFRRRASRLDRVKAITFDARIETLMERAAGIVAMGGYNTFCEILSFDKRALIVPRMQPRREQFIRASRAAELGLVTMLNGDLDRPPALMAEALHRLPGQPTPSTVAVSGLLEGLDTIKLLAARWLRRDGAPSALVGSHR